MRLAIFFDQDRCVGCHACIVACKLEHNLPPYPVCPPLANPRGPELIRISQVGPQIQDGEVRLHFQLISCKHCLDAPCIPACPHSAIYQDTEMGITLVHKDRCQGCRSCLAACPYGAPQFHNDKLVLCTLCIHRLGEGRRTACEAVCPARAIQVGATDDVPVTVAERPNGQGHKQESVRATR